MATLKAACHARKLPAISAGQTLFEEMVSDGQMPRGKKINSRVIWDCVQLDASFSDLDSPKGNSLDDLLRPGSRKIAERKISSRGVMAGAPTIIVMIPSAFALAIPSFWRIWLPAQP